MVGYFCFFFLIRNLRALYSLWIPVWRIRCLDFADKGPNNMSHVHMESVISSLNVISPLLSHHYAPAKWHRRPWLFTYLSLNCSWSSLFTLLHSTWLDHPAQSLLVCLFNCYFLLTHCSPLSEQRTCFTLISSFHTIFLSVPAVEK